jgi:hypothetical protein
MPRVTCRCGHKESVPADGPERIVCPKCAAKIRVRRQALPGPGESGDGFIRFACPCGRRLKVKAAATPQAGKCPDCGRIVPVPSTNFGSHPEAPTEDLSPADVAMLDEWSQRRQAMASPSAPPSASAAAKASGVKVEAGLRVCPRCGRPVHMGAVACRACGTHVPKR